MHSFIHSVGGGLRSRSLFKSKNIQGYSLSIRIVNEPRWIAHCGEGDKVNFE